MKLLMRVIALFFLTGIGLIGFGLIYLFTYGLSTPAVPDQASFEIDLPRIRELATGSGEPLPLALNALVLARADQPLATIVAGQSFSENAPRVFPSFQIAYEDRSIVVDAGYRPPPDPAALEALDRALDAAGSILLTHTHRDHLLALTDPARISELRDKLVLTREQYEESNYGIRSFPEGSLRDLEPLDVPDVHPFAPGVVLIKAPGHTEGSQLVFVRLENGREYLLVGDVVWSMENIRMLRGRPHVIGTVLIGGDEEQVADQIRALHELGRANEALELVVSHDAEHLERQIAEGLIGDGFSLGSPGVRPAVAGASR